MLVWKEVVVKVEKMAVEMAVHLAVMMSDMWDETSVGEWAVTMADLSVAEKAATTDD